MEPFFINTGRFKDDDEFVAWLFSSFLAPALKEQFGPDMDLMSIQGSAFLFGGPEMVEPAVLEHLQQLIMQENMDPVYAVSEMTTLSILRIRRIQYGNFRVTFVELRQSDQEALTIPSAEDLEARFLN